MWAKIFDLLGKLWSFGREQRRMSDDIRKLEKESEVLMIALSGLMDEVRQNGEALRLLRVEIQHLRKDESKEREMLVLRLEKELVKFENRLPGKHGKGGRE